MAHEDPKQIEAIHWKTKRLLLFPKGLFETPLFGSLR